ncbi:MAG: M14 family zinc carboxypeptidase, partial [Candidatus Promineifilaceae bacterium]
MKRIVPLFIMIPVVVFSALVLAREDTPASEGAQLGTDFVVVRAYYEDPSMVSKVAAANEPWSVNEEEGYILLSATPLEYDRLESLGFRLEVDEKLTALYSAPKERLPGQISGIDGYPCYRTVEETFASAEQIVQDHPTLAEWVDAGDSWEKVTPGGLAGYDIMVLKLTNKMIPGPKPVLFLTSGLHAREYTPPELNTRFAEYLVSSYDIDADVTWLLDYHELHLLLITNPDGRKQAESGLFWRKNTNADYCSPSSSNRGADLNRNFTFEWGNWGGSSPSECDSTYRGPSPASEPEIQAVQAYGRSIFPDQRDDALTAAAPEDAMGVYLDMHSSGNLVLWPWGFTTQPAPNGTALQTLGRRFAYFNGYDPDQSISLYPADGTSEEFGYGELGAATYTIEMGQTFFESCGYFENT